MKKINLKKFRYFLTILTLGTIIFTTGCSSFSQEKKMTQSLTRASLGHALDSKLFPNGRFALLFKNLPSDSILLKNGELFSPGGISLQNRSVIPAQLYNFKTHKFDLAQNSITPPRTIYSKIVLADGRVLLFGGNFLDKRGNQGLPSKSAEIYDPRTNTFSDISDTNYYSSHNTYCVLLQDGRVFIIGSGLTELFNPSTQKFTLVGIIKQYKFKQNGQEYIRKYSTFNKFGIVKPVLLNDGRVLLIGKSYNDSGNAEIYDPKTNSFRSTGQMKYNRSQFTATLLSDGRVLVVGGVNKEHEYGIAQAEIYNPKTNSFTTTGSLKQPRYDHSSILLSNGKVLIVNGTYGHSTDLKYLKEAELFDPKIGLFKKIGSSFGPRVYPELINLSKHQVLIPYGYATEIYHY